MFDEVDIKKLTKRIEDAIKEVQKPQVNVEAFIPFIKNINLFINTIGFRKIKICDDKYKIEHAMHGSIYCIGITISKNVKKEQIIYKQNKLKKLIGLPLTSEIVTKDHFEIMFSINCRIKYKKNDDIEVEEIELTDIDNQILEELYIINTEIKHLLVEHHEKELYELERKIALKELNHINIDVNFKE